VTAPRLTLSRATNEIDLTARTRSARIVRSIGFVLTLLFAAGCLASFVAGPETTTVRLLAGAAGLPIVLLFAWAAASRRAAWSGIAADRWVGVTCGSKYARPSAGEAMWSRRPHREEGRWPTGARLR
jgi:hypothetical protein